MNKGLKSVTYGTPTFIFPAAGYHRARDSNAMYFSGGIQFTHNYAALRVAALRW